MSLYFDLDFLQGLIADYAPNDPPMIPAIVVSKLIYLFNKNLHNYIQPMIIANNLTAF